jgi:cell division protein FtsI (penicillin-binding protein 3)
VRYEPLKPASPLPPGSPLARNHDLRLYFVAVCGTVWALAIVAQLFHLQILRHGLLLKEAERQSDRTITVKARRGTIVDRNERPFAISVDAPSIYADPSVIRDPKGAARALAHALGYSPADQKELLALLRQDRSFVWIKRQVDPAIARAVRELRLEGIGFETESRRVRATGRTPRCFPGATSARTATILWPGNAVAAARAGMERST